MAELFLISTADRVFAKLGSIVVQETGLAFGIKNELNKLKDTFAVIKAVLVDAEEQKFKNNELSVWLDRLKDVFYDVDDILDEFEIMALQKQINKDESIKNKVSSFFHHSNNTVLFSFKMASKIKKIRAKIDKIADDKAKFHLVERGVDRRDIKWDRETHSYLESSIVIGRDMQKIEIIDSLVKSDDDERVPIIPILGIGGIGKTTLAKLVFNDDIVVRHFQLRIWVWVSEDFNVKKLIASIFSEAPGIDYNSMSMEHLVACLQQKLRAKRYLLVLDDVWNEDPSKWMELKDLLMMGGSGSKVIVTTRSHIVASVVGTNSTCNLHGLPFNESSTLFHKWAFEQGKQEDQNLVEIGKDIVKKCKGVPLAIRTLGGLLRTKTDERDWLFVRDNEIWNLEQRKSDILPALRLSYNHLPSEVKHCFAMCSIFPKKNEFYHLHIVYLWMALGLVQPTGHNVEQELDEIGERYFLELVSRSFFQVVEKEMFSYSFKIHDLMHDLAMSMTRTECSAVNENTRYVSEKVRFVSFTSDNFMRKEVPSFLLQLTNLRAIWGVQRRSETFVERCISKFKCLRFLDLTHSTFEVLPSSIRNLKHLRFLDISYNRSLKSLPKALCELQSLQTLGLQNCIRLRKLPREIGNLISLRCLTLTTEERCFLEKGVGSLNALRLLCILDCENLEHMFDNDRIGQLRFPALRTLVIADCENLMSLPWCFRSLPALENLVIGNCKKLELDSEDDQDERYGDSVQRGALKRLKYLGITDIPKLVTLPQWLVKGGAETLKQIKIQYCPNFSALPEDLRSLCTLKIINCPKMMSLPDGLSSLHTLTEVHIVECPQLTERCQKVTGEDWHKIAHVPNVYLNGIKV